MAWLVRTRLTICLLALLFALASNSGETMSAQSSSAAPAEGQKASSVGELPVAASAKAPNPADQAKQLSKALQIAARRGKPSHLPDYISYGLGLPNATLQPLWAAELDVDGARRVYLVNDTDTAVVVTAAGEHTMVYLVRSGALKKAAIMVSGKYRSISLEDVPLASAVVGFNAERDLLLEQLPAKFPPKSKSKPK